MPVRRSDAPMSARFLPAIIAAITDVLAGGFVHSLQPDYPVRFVIFQIVMIGVALLFALPQRWLWVFAFVC